MYDTAIRYVDDHIQHVVDRLKENGLYEDTAIIISADHGENQGDLGGIYGEHGTADQATCRIPMIIKWPHGVSGKTSDAFHYNLDLAPTLMDLIGQPTEDIWDGESYSDTVLKGIPVGRDHVVVSQCAHVCQRSVRFDQWMYIRTYHDGNHLFPKEMLFDLETDPHEQNNLAEQHPEICREAAYRLFNWHDDQMTKMATYANDVVDPLWTVIREGGPFHARNGAHPQLLVDYLERLEETGRAEGAEKLRAKYRSILS